MSVLIPRRTVIEMHVMRTAAMIMMPPIVGVPAFARCAFGPSSRMLCPALIFLRTGMNMGAQNRCNDKSDQ